MTVGELKKLIKDIDDNTSIATYRSNMEGCGYTDRHVEVKVKTMYRIKETRYDAFDHTPYTVDVLTSRKPDDVSFEEVKVLVVE